jgi:hypothetical protein
MRQQSDSLKVFWRQQVRVVCSGVYLFVICLSTFGPARVQGAVAARCARVFLDSRLFESPSSGPANSGITTADIPVKFGLKGLEKLRGQQSNVGKRIRLTFSNRENGQQLIVGRIIEEFPAGLTLVDDLGQVHEINTNKGKIEAAFVEPVEYRWVRTQNRSTKAELFEFLAKSPGVKGLVRFSRLTDDKAYFLFGELSVVTPEPEYQVISVRDARGIIHLFDPSIVDLSFQIALDPDVVSGIFSSLSARKPQRVLDANWTKRQRFVRQLLAEERIFDNANFYVYFEQNLAESKRLLRRWYPDVALELIDAVMRGLGERFVPLLLEPGIANRSHELIRFGSDILAVNPDVSVWELRRQFSNHLGRRRIFRSMVLTEAERESIESRGILAPGLLDSRKAETALADIFAIRPTAQNVNYATDPYSEILSRLTVSASADPAMRLYISVSEYRSVAASIGYYDSGKVGEVGRHLYLFEVEVPEISIIRMNGLFQRESPYGGTVELLIGKDFRTNETKDLGVEMFMPFKIDRTDIKSVWKLAEPPPRWERRLLGP